MTNIHSNTSQKCVLSPIPVEFMLSINLLLRSESPCYCLPKDLVPKACLLSQCINQDNKIYFFLSMFIVLLISLDIINTTILKVMNLQGAV